MKDQNVKQNLINYINTRINYFSGGDSMKSMNESIRDEIFVKELKAMIKIIEDEPIVIKTSCSCQKCSGFGENGQTMAAMED